MALLDLQNMEPEHDHGVAGSSLSLLSCISAASILLCL